MVLTIISGSPSKTSVSIRIAFYLRKYLQNIIPEAEVNVLDCREYEIPLDDATYKSVESHAALQPLANPSFSKQMASYC